MNAQTNSSSKNNKIIIPSSTSPATVLLPDDTSVTSSCFSLYMADSSDRSCTTTRSCSLRASASSAASSSAVLPFLEEAAEEESTASLSDCGGGDHSSHHHHDLMIAAVSRHSRRSVRSTALSLFSSSSSHPSIASSHPSSHPSSTTHDDDDDDDDDDSSLDSLDDHYSDFHDDEEEDDTESGFDVELEFLADTIPSNEATAIKSFDQEEDDAPDGDKAKMDNSGRWSDEGDTATTPPSKPIPMPSLVPMDRSNTPTNDYLVRRYSGLLDSFGGSLHSHGTEGSLSNEDLLSNKNSSSFDSTSQGSRQSASSSGLRHKPESKPTRPGDSYSTWSTRSSPVSDLDLSLHLPHHGGGGGGAAADNNKNKKQKKSSSKTSEKRQGMQLMQDNSSQSLLYPLPMHLGEDRLKERLGSLRGRYEKEVAAHRNTKSTKRPPRPTKDYVPSVPQRHDSGHSLKETSFYDEDDDSDDDDEEEDFALGDSSGSLGKATIDESPGGWQPAELRRSMDFYDDHHPSLLPSFDPWQTPLGKSMRRHSTTTLIQHQQLNASLASLDSTPIHSAELTYDQPPSAPKRNVSGDELPQAESLLMVDDSGMSNDLSPTLPIRNTSAHGIVSKEATVLAEDRSPSKPVRTPGDDDIEKRVRRRHKPSHQSKEISRRDSSTSDTTPVVPMRNVSDHSPVVSFVTDDSSDNDKVSTDPRDNLMSSMTETDDDTSEEKASSESSAEDPKDIISPSIPLKQDAFPARARDSSRSLLSDLPRLVSFKTQDLSLSEHTSSSPKENSSSSINQCDIVSNEDESERKTEMTSNDQKSDVTGQEDVTIHATQKRAPEPPSTSIDQCSTHGRRTVAPSNAPNSVPSGKEDEKTKGVVHAIQQRAPDPPSPPSKPKATTTKIAAKLPNRQGLPVVRRQSKKVDLTSTQQESLRKLSEHRREPVPASRGGSVRSTTTTGPIASGDASTPVTPRGVDKPGPNRLPGTATGDVGSTSASVGSTKSRPRFFKMFSWSGRSKARPRYLRTFSLSLSSSWSSRKKTSHRDYPKEDAVDTASGVVITAEVSHVAPVSREQEVSEASDSTLQTNHISLVQTPDAAHNRFRSTQLVDRPNGSQAPPLSRQARVLNNFLHWTTEKEDPSIASKHTAASKKKDAVQIIQHLSRLMDQMFADKTCDHKEFECAVCELQVVQLPQAFDSNCHQTAFLLNLFNLMVRHAVILSFDDSRSLPPWPKKLSELELFLAKTVAYNIGGEIIFAFDVHKALFDGSDITPGSAALAMGDQLPWWRRLGPRSKSLLPHFTAGPTDPRLIFAITYGTMSSNQVVTADPDPANLETHLNFATQQYCQKRIAIKDKMYGCVIKLPQIFKWHRAILSGNQGTKAFVGSFLRFLSQEQIADLTTGSQENPNRKWRIRYRKYDWNIQGPQQQPEISEALASPTRQRNNRLSAIDENVPHLSTPDGGQGVPRYIRERSVHSLFSAVTTDILSVSSLQ